MHASTIRRRILLFTASFFYCSDIFLFRVIFFIVLGMRYFGASCLLLNVYRMKPRDILPVCLLLMNSIGTTIWWKIYMTNVLTRTRSLSFSACVYVHGVPFQCVCEQAIESVNNKGSEIHSSNNNNNKTTTKYKMPYTPDSMWING